MTAIQGYEVGTLVTRPSKNSQPGFDSDPLETRANFAHKK